MSGKKGGEEGDRQWNLRSLMLVGMINLSPLSIRLLDIIVWSIWRQMQESIKLPGRQVISLKRIHLDFNPTFSFYSKKTSFSCSFPLIRFLFPSPATPWARDCRFSPPTKARPDNTFFCKLHLEVFSASYTKASRRTMTADAAAAATHNRSGRGGRREARGTKGL